MGKKMTEKRVSFFNEHGLFFVANRPALAPFQEGPEDPWSNIAFPEQTVTLPVLANTVIEAARVCTSANTQFLLKGHNVPGAINVGRV